MDSNTDSNTDSVGKDMTTKQEASTVRKPTPADDGRTASDSDSSRKLSSKFGKTLLFGLGALFVFSVGVGVGDGRISIGFDTNSSGMLPQQLDYASVDDVYDTLRQTYDGKLDKAVLLAGLKDGLAGATGDPYTQYFTPEEAKKFDSQLNNEFSGIGAELGQDKDKNLIVVSPIAGTPAAIAGLKAQDIIVEIDKVDSTKFSVEEAVGKIRGPKGTKVTLKLIRNRTQTVDLTITRDDIRVPAVVAKVLDGPKGNVGYLRVNTFADNAAVLAATEAQKLRDQNVTGIIFDVRGNPGGRVDAAIGIASLWLPKGKIIMQEKRGSVVEKTHTASGGNILEGLPTIVLQDGGSASASEIVAGALRDNDVARIVGEKSYGKGSVQQVVPLDDGGELKVTVARWFRPNGQNIDKKGVDPDRKVKTSDADVTAGKDTQLEAAQAELNK